MKATKATVTIFSALASVIILTSCAPKPTENKTTESGTSDNKISMTYEQLRSRENTMSTLWYQKAAETKALCKEDFSARSCIDKRTNSFSGCFISCRRPLGQRMHTTVDVGIVSKIVVLDSR